MLEKNRRALKPSILPDLTFAFTQRYLYCEAETRFVILNLVLPLKNKTAKWADQGAWRAVQEHRSEHTESQMQLEAPPLLCSLANVPTCLTRVSDSAGTEGQTRSLPRWRQPCSQSGPAHIRKGMDVGSSRHNSPPPFPLTHCELEDPRLHQGPQDQAQVQRMTRMTHRTHLLQEYVQKVTQGHCKTIL